jgi:hypothetical protein
MFEVVYKTIQVRVLSNNLWIETRDDPVIMTHNSDLNLDASSVTRIAIN